MTAPDPTAGEHVIEERGRVYDRCRCGWYGSLGDTHVAASTGTSEDVEALEVLLYEHREDSLTCYDHGGYCCACGEHDLLGYRTHLAELLAAREAAARAEALRTVAADMVWDFEDHPVTRSAVREWLNEQADRIAREGR